MPLHDRIKKIRLDLNFSQASFSQVLGISRGHISTIETGAAVPSKQLIKLICTKFGIDENWLQSGQGTMRTVPNEFEMEEFDQIMEQFRYEDMTEEILEVVDAIKSAKKKIDRDVNRGWNTEFRIRKSHELLGPLLMAIIKLGDAYQDLDKFIRNILNKYETIIENDEKKESL